ncbi:MAG: hypothetical protein NTW21_01780 [Verrucomicrobia bacterium]|nr:hypothetical protein [Verrucomicrobiota bacterium]
MSIRNPQESQAGEQAGAIRMNPFTLSVAGIMALAACLSLPTASASVWRIDSNPQHTADFRTPQEANDSALVLNDDTLLIASASDAQVYGTLTLTKRLKVVGTGYWLRENFKSLIAEAQLGDIRFETGSGGSTISNLYFGSAYPVVSVNNITIYRCRFNSVNDQSRYTNGWIIRNCICNNILFNGSNSGHVTVTGNIIESSMTIGPMGSTTVTFNTIWSVPSVYHATFNNNIVVANYPLLYAGSTANNNVTAAGATVDSTSTSTAIYGIPTNWRSLSTTYREDTYRPANNVFVMDGTNPVGPISNWGAFAGGYTVSGLPSVPVIIGLDAPTVIQKGQPLPVTVTVKSQP